MRIRCVAILQAVLAVGVAAVGASGASPIWESFTYVNSAQSLALWQDTAWVGTTGGLVQWDVSTGTPEIHLAPDGFPDGCVTAVVVDTAGRPWIGLGTWAGGLAVLENGEWTSWGSEDGLASNWVLCIAIDSVGRKWIGTVRGMTVLDDGRTPADRSDDRTTSFRSADGLANETVSGICLDPQGRAWVATSGGLSVLDVGHDPLDTSDDVWTSFRKADGLLADDSQCVAVDDAGHIWIGARGGVSVLDFGETPTDPSDDQWTTFVAELGFSSTTYCFGIAFRDGTAYVATGKGLVLLEGASTPFDRGDDNVTNLGVADGLLASQACAVSLDDEGVVWCATLQGGLSRLDAGGTPSDKTDDTWVSYAVEGWLFGADVRAVRAEAGVTWAGASALTATDGTESVRFDVGIPLAVDRSATGTLWVATTGGITALDDAGTPFDKADDAVTFFSSDDGLPLSYVRAVSVDASDRVWIATQKGIGVLDPAGTPHDKSDDRWLLFTKADGLAGDNTNAIKIEGDRRVWVVHESNSVSCLDHAGTPFSKEDDAWFVFGEGSPIGPASGYSVIVDREGLKWFGLCPGLFAFDDGGTLADTSDDRWQRYDIGDCNPGLALDERGRMWVATGWSGVVLLDFGGTPFDTSDDVLVEYRVGDGLIDDRAQAIFIDGGVVWIATDGGLSRLVP
ncbi:MAG: two-component regulator propeller domain-containing protein [Candidatus Bipolaricaulota bacterium]